MLQQYTYIISHNLRAPVANLLGLADILERDLEDTETTRQVAARVNTVSRKLDQYILDLNEILLLQHDAIHSFSTFNLKDEIVDLAENYQEELLKVSGDLSLTLPDTLMFHGIRTYLRSILENLVSNAIKYRNPLRTLHINLKAWLEWGNLNIKVEDNGLGLDLALHKEHLFKMYTRFHAQGEGRGMGLFLVKTQVEAMSGEIAVESQPGIGSTFIVKLPYVPGA
jgi:signal transduction histidine kinase